MKKRKFITLFLIFIISVSTFAFFMVTTNAASLTHEAEDDSNGLKYASVIDNYIEFDAKKDAYVEMKNVNSPDSGTVKLTFVYSKSSSDSVPVEVKVNGTTVVSKEEFDSTGGKWTEKSIEATMESGSSNKIRFKLREATEGVCLDKVIISTDTNTSDTNDSNSDNTDNTSDSNSDNTGTDAEVTLSGSTYTAKVGGSTVYSGNRYFDAINSACNNAGKNAYIEIKNSGSSGNDGGNVYAIKPLAGQTLDFNGCQVDCNSNGDLVVAVYTDRKDNITVKDLRVKGNPRYGIWSRGCSNLTLTDITMDLSDDSPVGLGIRVDSSTADSSNLTINGDIKIEGSAGHAIETYSIDGVNIGDVTVNDTGGCGLLLNDSTDCKVGVVTGKRNCTDVSNGGYATFRVANTNGSTYVEGVYSRNSGRGFFSVSDSHDCTIGWVDIADTTLQGIFLQTAKNTYVNSGTVSNGNPDVQHIDCSNVKTSVNGKTYKDNDGKW